MYPPPGGTPAPPPARYGPPFKARAHAGLHLLASGCVLSAWITLVLSLLIGIYLIANRHGGGLAARPAGGLTLPQPPVSGPYGLEDLGATGTSSPGSQVNALSALLGLLLPGLKLYLGLMTIVSGVFGWLLQLSIGYVLRLFLDMEENTRLTAQALTAIARRTGAT